MRMRSAQRSQLRSCNGRQKSMMMRTMSDHASALARRSKRARGCLMSAENDLPMQLRTTCAADRARGRGEAASSGAFSVAAASFRRRFFCFGAILRRLTRRRCRTRVWWRCRAITCAHMLCGRRCASACLAQRRPAATCVRCVCFRPEVSRRVRDRLILFQNVQSSRLQTRFRDRGKKCRVGQLECTRLSVSTCIQYIAD